jgi:hypothetical protein
MVEVAFFDFLDPLSTSSFSPWRKGFKRLKRWYSWSSASGLSNHIWSVQKKNFTWSLHYVHLTWRQIDDLRVFCLVQTKQPKRNNDFIVYYTFFIWVYRESFSVVAVLRVVVIRLKQIEFVNEIDCNWMVLSLSDFRRNEWMKILMLFILCSHKMILQFAQVL